MMKGLAGKRVVITGGAAGIGRAAVDRFLAEGARVAVIDRDAEGCARLRDDRPQLAAVLETDIAQPAEVAEAFDRLDRHLNGLDVLINNAGISLPHRFVDIPSGDWRRVMAVDLDGVFLCGQAAARRMLAAGRGVIINMGSVSGLVGMPGYAAYNTAKAGVIELTRTMALELAPTVRVVCVCPGYVLTPMQKAEYTPAQMDAVNAQVPLRRHADPAEIAALFAFLASEEAPFMTGSAVVIDGGETAGGLASHPRPPLPEHGTERTPHE